MKSTLLKILFLIGLEEQFWNARITRYVSFWSMFDMDVFLLIIIDTLQARCFCAFYLLTPRPLQITHQTFHFNFVMFDDFMQSLCTIQCNLLWVRVMVFDDTFNNISVISWRSVLLVKETYRIPPISHWQISHDVSSTPRHQQNPDLR
jgi:hypothetical protein